MSASNNRRVFSPFSTAMVYLGVSTFVALFGGIYEYFSHEIFSYFMVYAFAIPLLLGAFPWMIMGLKHASLPHPFSSLCWHCGIATVTTGSVYQGVLEIYGTTHHLMPVYWILGGGLLALSLLLSLVLPRVRA